MTRIKKIAETDIPVESDDGVDLTLIRWMLSLTPAERLAVAQSAVDSIREIRDASSVTRPLDGSVELSMIDLEGPIKTNEAAGRKKDGAVLAILRRTLEERDRP